MTDAAAQRNLTPKQEAFVAAYLGDCRFNATKAAIAAGYSPHTAAFIGAENLKKPQIQTAIQAWRDLVKSRGIATLEYRLNRLDELERTYFDLIEARKKAYSGSEVIGGDTGLVVVQKKSIGSGPSAYEVEEYVADVAVTKEIRAIYEDAAKEMGQRVEKSETKHDATEAFMEALRAFGDRDA